MASFIDPNLIYRAFKQSDDFTLTAEQSAAVSATHESPVLVVAGAGSGKTEMMAVRVLWLVANRLAKPQEILGLTFTKKAASELSKRINNGLLALEKSEYWPSELAAEGYALPTVSTYNSYANTLFRDNALALGYEPESTLLTDGAAFALAKSVVLKNGNLISSFDGTDELSLNSAVKYVISLAAQLNDNLSNGEEVIAQFDALRDKLMQITGGDPLNGENTKFFGGAFKTAAVVELAELYRLEKKKQGVVDYSDQVALAEQISSAQKQVADSEKSRNKFVLLDEYQDTSYLQTRLLLALYQDHPVFAVGDPNQSIYGWRGASATNLNEYVENFSSKPSVPVVQLELPTSWRNPKVVLDIANIIAKPLASFAPYQQNRGLVATRVLELQPNDRAGVGQIDVLWEDHALDEAKYVASWMARRMSTLSANGEKPTGAVILRKRALMQLFQGELEAVGLETHIVGLGGLMDAPEIIDLVSALKVVHSPNAGGELIRVLAGPRWRISAKDISRLHRWAKKIGRLNDKDLAEKAGRTLGAEYETSLIDALDLLLDSKKLSLYGMSESSLNRLRDAAQLFRELRQHTGLPLVEFVKHVARELQLDIELAANPRRSHPFSNLNAFNDIVSNYVGSSNGYLGAFLEWLEFEADPNKIESPAAQTEKGVVQILTVHAAKGLEWDYVAVGNVTSVDFPDTKGTLGWLTAGELPYSLRGDSRSLPVLDLSTATKQPQLKSVRDQFKNDMKTHIEREERRLAYVAFTRPKRELLISGSRWKPGHKSVGYWTGAPSAFMQEVVDSGLANITIVNQIDGKLPQFDSQENPYPLEGLVEAWPTDPLGEQQRIRVTEAAAAVNRNLQVPEGADLARPIPGQQRLVGEQPEGELAAGLLREVDLLIGEQVELDEYVKRVKLPVRIPASRFKDFLKKPDQVAQSYRRPMPEEPYAATMQGTLFHAWVEARYGIISNADQLDDPTGAVDELELTAEELEKLQENFLSSAWASREPLAIEEEIQVTIEQNTFICKLDAVFEADAELKAQGKTIEIVDWKTGKAPEDSEIDERALQLALYRMAYSRFHGVPENEIAVCLYYVAENKVIRPERVLSSSELEAEWQRVLKSFEQP